MPKSSDESVHDRQPTVFWEPGDPLPAFGSIDGVDVALIAKSEYLRLVSLRASGTREQITEAARARRAPPPGLSTVEKDAEVAAFLCDLFRGRMTLVALHKACVERFGEERAPSPGRIQTFRSRWRAYR